MNPFTKIIQWIKDPNYFFKGLLLKLSPILPDKFFLSCMVRVCCGYWPNWKNPQTFSEKIQWLKLYNRRPEYTMMVDKYAVKDYVAKKIGEKYIIPTLGVWDKPEDIDWDVLPNQFVLKTTHGGGNTGVVICKDKTKFDRQKAIVKLNNSLKQDIYKTLREWPYKEVPRRIIAEQYIAPRPDVKDLPDYKWFCFNGEPKFCQLIQDRTTKETINFFDTEWKHQVFVGINPAVSPVEDIPAHPENLQTQLRIACELSKDIPFARIDLYQIESDTFFGEIILFPKSGLGNFRPNEYNAILGQMLHLPGEIFGGAICKMKPSGEMEIKQPDLSDYKFFSFDGEVKALFIGTERSTGNVKFDYYDAEFNHLDLVQVHPMSGKDLPKPINFEEMKEIASKLSQGLPHVRVDLYNVNGKVYFGELTFFHHGGVTPFHPQSWDYTFGSWIHLPDHS